MFIAHSMRTATALLGAVAVLAIAKPAAADNDPTTFGGAAIGISAAICTMVYTPLKIAWAITGVKVAGLVYAFSAGNADVAGRVLRTSAGGDYVITPEVLKGTQVLRLIGD